MCDRATLFYRFNIQIGTKTQKPQLFNSTVPLAMIQQRTIYFRLCMPIIHTMDYPSKEYSSLRNTMPELGIDQPIL